MGEIVSNLTNPLLIIVNILLVIVGWFAVKTLTRVDENQKLLFERMRTTELELTEVRTKQNMCSICTEKHVIPQKNGKRAYDT